MEPTPLAVDGEHGVPGWVDPAALGEWVNRYRRRRGSLFS